MALLIVLNDKKKAMKTLFLFISILIYPLTLQSQTALPVKTLSVYKNGTAMITKEGTVPVINDTVKLSIPDAITGTYWLTTPRENLIKSVSFKDNTVKVKKEYARLKDLVNNNIGKRIKFSMIVNDATVNITGIIKRHYEPLGMMHIEENDNSMFVKLEDMINFSIQDMNDIRWVDSTERMAYIKTNKSVSEITVRESSLQNSISWKPYYYLSLNKDNTARLEMKSLIENFSNENFENTSAEVIVGVPLLSSTEERDPMIISNHNTNPSYEGGKEATLLISNSQGTGSYALGGAQNTFNNSSGMVVEQGKNAFAVLEEHRKTNFGTETVESDNLFIYKIGNISLSKNTKALFPIFSQLIGYNNLYECKIDDYTNYENNRFLQTNEKISDVFHSLEIKNTTEFPITSGSLLVADDEGRLVAQTKVNYISKNSASHVRLSKDLNTLVKSNEEEIGREENVKKIKKKYIHKVKIRGTITLDNFDEKSKKIKVRKTINGLVVSAEGSKVTKDPKTFGLNPQSTVQWEVEVPASSQKEITYDYDVYYQI